MRPNIYTPLPFKHPQPLPLDQRGLSSDLVGLEEAEDLDHGEASNVGGRALRVLHGVNVWMLRVDLWKRILGNGYDESLQVPYQSRLLTPP